MPAYLPGLTKPTRTKPLLAPLPQTSQLAWPIDPRHTALKPSLRQQQSALAAGTQPSNCRCWLCDAPVTGAVRVGRTQFPLAITQQALGHCPKAACITLPAATGSNALLAHNGAYIMEKQQRGFALMDPERRTQVARSGGRTAHQQGRAHKFTSAEAAAAGRVGGRRVSENRSHMSEIGRRGGRSRSILTQLGGPARELLHSLSAGQLLICQANSTFLFGPLTQGEPIVNAPQKPRRELADLYQLGLLTDREVNDGATPRGWLRVILTARAKRMVAAKLRAR